MTKEKAILLLKRSIDQIRQVKATARFGATFKKWYRDTGVALGKIFPYEPGHVQDFANIQYKLSILTNSTPDSKRQSVYDKGLEHAEVFLQSCIDEIEEYWDKDSTPTTKDTPAYVDKGRIEELASIGSTTFDLVKLIRLCEELNTNYAAGNYYSMIMLTRSILDHVPPIFAAKSFAEVASQIKGKSKKDLLQRLEQTSRKLADIHLHQQIRKKEALPNPTQINFSSELDILFSEIIHELL
jgi:hypothetical protein